MTQEQEKKLICELEMINSALCRIACCLEGKYKSEISSETIGKAAADYAKEYTRRAGENPCII